MHRLPPFLLSDLFGSRSASLLPWSAVRWFGWVGARDLVRLGWALTNSVPRAPRQDRERSESNAPRTGHRTGSGCETRSALPGCDRPLGPGRCWTPCSVTVIPNGARRRAAAPALPSPPGSLPASSPSPLGRGPASGTRHATRRRSGPSPGKRPRGRPLGGLQASRSSPPRIPQAVDQAKREGIRGKSRQGVSLSDSLIPKRARTAGIMKSKEQRRRKSDEQRTRELRRTEGERWSKNRE